RSFSPRPSGSGAAKAISGPSWKPIRPSARCSPPTTSTGCSTSTTTCATSKCRSPGSDWADVATLIQSRLPGIPLLARGKVRELYDLGDRLLIVASDRVSAFDVVMREPIPGKGAVLTGLSAFWFEQTGQIVPNHLLSTDPADFPAEL